MRSTLTSLIVLAAQVAVSQSIPKSYYTDLQYRCIGTHRAGRTVGAMGVPSRPNVFYIGVNNGGVWKTDDYGRTWQPIFDQAPTGSVGDIAVSPSNPEIIYVGTGEGLHRPDLSIGDGIYKSTDGGRSWVHVGLRDVQQVGRLVVHPFHPEIVFVAGLGHPYGANEERGIFRTKDGGKNWEKVLYINHNTGAIQVEFDPSNPNVLYADMWEHREGPWENGSFSGPNSGLYKSTDGGSTWKQLTVGLPTGQQGLGRIGVCIAPSNAQRLYATVDAREHSGIYRSDDGGANWKRVSQDSRIFGRGSDFAELKVHPRNPDIVFSGNVAAYKSYDGGYTWYSNKGAPGGDDYHRIWINPDHPDIMLFAADQGAIVTVNGGRTWSSWYNQPTAQLYHVSTDNQFPYWVYGGQQESGGIGVASRGPGGQISFRDWMGVGADEYAYVAPDPKDHNIVYGGRVTRFDKRTGQTQNVAPEALRSGQYRFLRTLPLLFHPANPAQLLFATNVLWSTTTGGQSWEVISPDLTRKQPEVPASIGDFISDELKSMRQRAVIYAVGPSPLNKDVIWAGTDDGLVHMTRDGGKTWKVVTPKAIASWDKISQIDAGHFDENTAYISVTAMRKDDMRPHIFRTHDGGATWTEVVTGMSKTAPVNVVREDPVKRGLLFAGTETEVWFSADDGENWQSLRNNMPASSVRDLVVKDDDLVVGTHGRSIWILDNINPLRDLPGSMNQSGLILYTPARATRVRNNMFSDTPLPPEEPAGINPPDGAIIDYWLKEKSDNVDIEIMDSNHRIIRHFSSDGKTEVYDTVSMPYPTYWLRPAAKAEAGAGHHRFIWDLRYDPPAGSDRQLPIAAVNKSTGTVPVGPFVPAGTYIVRLKAGALSAEKELKVRMDPRVTTSAADIAEQHRNSMICYGGYRQLQDIRESIDKQLNDPKARWQKGMKELWTALRGNGMPDDGNILYGSIYETPPERETIVGMQGKLLHMLVVLQSADTRPTASAVSAVEKLAQSTQGLIRRWETLRK